VEIRPRRESRGKHDLDADGAMEARVERQRPDDLHWPDERFAYVRTFAHAKRASGNVME